MARARSSLARRVAVGSALAAAAAVAAWLALSPRAVAVDVAETVRGPLVVTVAEEGRTRVRDRHVVTAPATGRLRRVEVEPGDAVSAGGVVAVIAAPEPALHDARSRQEASARVEAALDDQASLEAAAARATAVESLAARELDRVRSLHADGVLPRASLDEAEAALRTAAAGTRSALFAVRVAAHQLELARTQLAAGASLPDGSEAVSVVSPVDGRVLRVLRESAGPVTLGEPLVEVGDVAALEAVVDLVTTDVVAVRPGAAARLEAWGGKAPLRARVRRVEPSAYTKVSALGVEEQRVDVVLDIEPAATGEALPGDGYAVDVRITTWESDDVLQVPSGALFRDGQAWAAFVVREGRAHLVRVEAGHWADDAVEVLSGLAAGDVVVLHPPGSLGSGDRVRVVAVDRPAIAADPSGS